ncbi:fungal-specific transcription factor domain-containing protein [Penicillium hetheringtonii]|uniref:Fungal-specific transcription factor domain-containing protein n=1 Tax=Penicillium hetheringtonii TaxID=911720 RepID=A0AAD6GL45_9EURO|nr:fungal-specific transcription factor domain-containing protein [Penicillium hetheringtonii]
MAGYASRFASPTLNNPGSERVQTSASHGRQPAWFLDIAFKYINQALMDYDDNVPPLCLIQALIVATHCRLTQGVRGKAWRSLGLCVSLIYESNLHCLDSGKDSRVNNVFQWQEDEEKRRAFWAIWEMDVFASTIRRTPTLIDWNHMEVLLPVDNMHWFAGQPSASCFMQNDPNHRWKALQDSGNPSPKAWYLVINSLMKEAQVVRDMQAVSSTENIHHNHQRHHHRTPYQYSSRPASSIEDFFGIGDYRDQYLAFRAPGQGQMESQRQQHCSVCNIYVMTQLAHLMIYRNDAFIIQNFQPETSSGQFAGAQAEQTALRLSDTENMARQQYYEAADRILRIVNQSCVEHIQYINPFLSSTIWLAAAVQLVRKYLTRESSNQGLIRSRFDVLHLSYQRCVEFWDIQNALQRNLESIWEQLELRYKKREAQGYSNSQEVSRRATKNGLATNRIYPDRESVPMERDATAAQTLRQPPKYLPEMSNDVLRSPTYIGPELEITAQTNSPQYLSPDAMEILDAINSLNPNGDPSSEASVGATGSNLVSPMYQLDQAFDWPTFDFPGGFHALFTWGNPF